MCLFPEPDQFPARETGDRREFPGRCCADSAIFDLDESDTNTNVGDRALNKDIADAFCNEFRSVFENWATCRIVFRDLPSQAERSDTPMCWGLR